MENNDYKTRLYNFVYEGRFINPEKMEAVEEFGLDKAEEMWQNGEPTWEIRSKLQTNACQRALYVRKYCLTTKSE